MRGKSRKTQNNCEKGKEKRSTREIDTSLCLYVCKLTLFPFSSVSRFSDRFSLSLPPLLNYHFCLLSLCDWCPEIVGRKLYVRHQQIGHQSAVQYTVRSVKFGTVVFLKV